MKIFRLRKEDRDIFRRLDPFERLVILDNPCGFALVSITDEGEDIMPAGLLVGTLTDSMIAIDWMAVNPSVQEQGLGEELLRTVFDLADAGKIGEVCAVINEEYEKENFSKGCGEYFDDRLFKEREKAFGDVVISLDELADLKYFKQDPLSLPKPLNLASLPATKSDAILEQLFSIPASAGLVEPGYMRGVIDPELCFVFMDGNEAYGGFLVQKAGDYLMPVYYCAESPREGAALILASFNKAVSRYRDMDVLILQREKKSYKILSDIIPGMDRSTMLRAKLSDYRKLR